MVEKICVVCGKAITPVSGKTTVQIYCGKRCQNKAKTANRITKEMERQAITEKRNAAKNTKLDACMREAEKRGISYGKYMAMREPNEL